MWSGLLFVRRRGVVSGTVLAVVSSAVVVFAANAQGFPTSHVSLNDGGVWVTSNQALTGGSDPDSPNGAFARYNKAIGQFDTSFSPPGVAQAAYDVDVFQNAATVVARDLAVGRVYQVDVANSRVDQDASVAVPSVDQVSLGGTTLAVLEPATGKVWIHDATTLTNFTLDRKPDAIAGAASTLAVAQDGTVFVASASKHELLGITTSSAITPVVRATPLPSNLNDLTVTAVGSTPVVLDKSSGEVWRPGHAVTQVGAAQSAGSFVLQQSGAAAATVLVANGSSLFSLSLKSSAVTTVSSIGTGTPAQPVRLDGCVYGAWAGGVGALARGCDNQPASTYSLSSMGAIGPSGLVFRVNRDVIALNDPATGAVDNVSGTPTRVDNWDQVKPAVQDTTQGAKTQGTQASATSANHAFTAQGDTLGARPGRVTILHVLDNDSAPVDDILAVASVTTPDNPQVSVSVTPDGQAVAVNVPANVTAGEVNFKYTASDDKGQTSSAPVTVQIRQPTDNVVPAPRPGLTPKTWSVAPSGVFSYPVLSDWRDFDGDSLVVKSVTSGAGSVSADADGRITFIAPPTAGPQSISYTVWDGVGDPVSGSLDVTVLDANANPIPATAEPDVARALVGQSITISPLANDIAGADPTNPQAQLQLSGTIPSPVGATVTSDTTAGTVTFVATQPGTFDLTYGAAFGSARVAKGQIRIDVAQQPTTRGGPVAMPDVAVLKGQQPATVDVLANDTDPSGGVLTVESAAAVDAQSGLEISVVQGRWLRIVATTPNIGGPRLVQYQMTDGTTAPVTGDVTVTQLPAAATDALPIAQDDTAIVRAGDVVSVNVLSNDSDPNGLPLVLVQGGLGVRPQLGAADASGTVVRYAAPSTVTTPKYVVVDYIVQDDAGNSATGHVDITINPIDAAHDAPPRPQSLEARVAAGGTVTLSVPTSNVDPDGDSVIVTGVSKAPQLGEITSFDHDSLTYKAYATSAGTDTFDYQVQDRFGEVGTATVRVGIVPQLAPQQPVAVDDAVTAAPGAQVHIDVLANDFIPTGDHVTIEPLVSTNRVVPAGVSLNGTLILLKAPAVGVPLVFSYGITDGTGVTSVAQVTVHSKAGYDIPPIARDDTVTVLPAGVSVTVAVTVNDDDPQGDRSDLKVTKVFDPQVVISGNSLVITIKPYAQTIGYEIADPAGSVAMAVVSVPGRAGAVAPPRLKPDVSPVQVAQGGQKTISLSDYVVDPRGKSVRLTTLDKISGAPANALQVTSHGDTTLVLHSVGSYSGLATVTFEVTDGTNLSDPAGLKAVLTIPVVIGSAPPTLKCPTTPLTVTAGGAPVLVDIASLCQVVVSDPSQLAGLKYTSSLSGVAGVALTSSGTSGQQLRVTANPEAKPMTSGTINLQIAGVSTAHATIGVSVVAAPLATVTSISVGGVKAGQTAVVDVASYVQSPFGPKVPIQVLGVRQTSTGVAATTSFSGTKVSVTPPADAHGTFTFAVSITDLPSQPARTVQGLITMEVLGVPSQPGAPTLVSTASHTVVLGFAPSQPNGSPIDQYEIDSAGKIYNCDAAPCTVTGLTNNQAYTFTVRAHNGVGWSQPSVPSASATPDQVPDLVSGLIATPGDTTVALQWVTPTVDGSPVSSFDVQISPDPGTGAMQHVAAPGTTLTWSGLQNGTQYTFQVRAENKAGPGQFGTPVQAIPFGTPPTMAAPTAVAVQSADPHEQAVTVSWPAADGNGRDITGYVVTGRQEGCSSASSNSSNDMALALPAGFNPGGSCECPAVEIRSALVVPAGYDPVPCNQNTTTLSIGPDQTTAVFTIKNDGSSYSFSIVATNAGGLTSDSSPYTAPPVSAVGIPDTISTPTAKDAGNAEVYVTFTVPNPNGFTNERLEYSLNGVPQADFLETNGGFPAGEIYTYPIVDLTNGVPYAISIRSCNEAGLCGAWSEPSNQVTPYGPVGTPQNVTVNQVDANTSSLVVNWSAVPDNGRGPITYTVSVSPGGTCNITGTSCRADNLSWATTYTFSVVATDSGGLAGSAGSASGGTPAQPAPTPPAAPTSWQVVTNSYTCPQDQFNTTHFNGSSCSGEGFIPTGTTLTVVCYVNESPAWGFTTWYRMSTYDPGWYVAGGARGTVDPIPAGIPSC